MVCQSSFFMTQKRMGNICTLNTDAIVNSTNESMTNATGLSGQVLEAAGPEIRSEIYKTEQCRTGEARITSAGALPCKYVSRDPDNNISGPSYTQ
jgi:O-acetyl-ADP-ribose deacetylase (regulator of RNase III)